MQKSAILGYLVDLTKMKFVFGICLLVSLAAVSTQAWKASLKKSFTSAGLGLSILTGAALPSFADGIPAVGSKAPDFSLPSNTGSNIGLKDFISGAKYSVIFFYPKDGSQGCTIESKNFERDLQKYKDMGAQILGISVDSVNDHLDFAKKYGLEYPLASDQGGAVSNKYGSVLDIPFLGKFSNRQTYIVDRDGTVRFVFTDVESKLASHSTDVLTKLSELTKT